MLVKFVWRSSAESSSPVMLLSLLGKDFMQISKSAVINLKQIDFVEPSFSGMMKLFLKNKQSEYISRKYLSEFKKYLGL